MRRLLIIDNYDSFTYNLVQAFAVLGVSVRVVENDRTSVREIARALPDFLVLSPGPKGPRDAGISLSVVRELSGKLPILGVCLGHQCIAETFGSAVVRAPVPVHGKTSAVFHDGSALFEGIPSGFRAARYHSLLVDRVPEGFTLSAWTEQREIMAISQERRGLFGIQFHPESFLTEHGARLLLNFLRLA